VRENRAQYAESRRRAGVRLERVYLMPTPAGRFAVAYLEAERDFLETQGVFMSSGDPFDQEFMRRLGDVHGFDPTQPPPGPPPEVVAEWWDPEARSRRHGLAFVAPLRPGSTDDARAFAREAFQDRVDELTASRRDIGQNGEVVVLNSTPMGDVVCVYLEGDDPAESNRRFAASQRPYDVWFKARCRDIFPDDIDFNEPLPPIEQIWDWQAGSGSSCARGRA